MGWVLGCFGTLAVFGLLVFTVSVLWVRRNVRRSIRCEPEPIGRRREPGCPVDGCTIAVPHSHTEALLRKMKGL